MYTFWCSQNMLPSLKSRSFSDAMVAVAAKYGLEHCNTIILSGKRRVWGYKGVEALVDPRKAGVTDASVRTYVPKEGGS